MSASAWCEVPGDNHSKDRVTCWRGHVIPTRLCGYHASRLMAGTSLASLMGGV